MTEKNIATPSSEPVVVQAELLEQIARDKAEWDSLSPGVRQALENELAAVWPNFPHRIEATREAQGTPAGEIGELVERLRALEAARTDFVAKRLAMNAAIPDVVNSTPAERALYDERYKADHEAEREVFRVGQTFAQWATDFRAADTITSLQATVSRLEAELEWYGEQARLARLIHSEGDKGRQALADDGGKRARAALTEPTTKYGHGSAGPENGEG